MRRRPPRTDARRAQSQPQHPVRQLDGVGIGRAGGNNRSGARDVKTVKQRAVVQEISRQAGARPPAMLFHQSCAAFIRCKIQRILVPHAAGDAELGHERFKTGNGLQAGAIGARGALKTVGFAQLPQWPVDLPQQHRGRGHRAAAAGQLAIDNDDIQPLPRQPFGHQRPGDPRADDQRIACKIVAHFEPRRVS